MGMASYIRKGEAADANSESIGMARETLPILLQGYEACDVYNLDETGFVQGQQPRRTFASEPVSGGKLDKERFTLALCVNADGSDFRSPIVIGKAKRPRSFKNDFDVQDYVFYRSNKKAWMTSEVCNSLCILITRIVRTHGYHSKQRLYLTISTTIVLLPPSIYTPIQIFSQWVDILDANMTEKGRRIVLLVDNASSHKVVKIEGAIEGYLQGFKYVDVGNVRVIYLPPNCTSHVQPLDQGVISTLKLRYRKLLVEWLITEFEKPSASSTRAGDQVAAELPVQKINVRPDLRMAIIWISGLWNSFEGEVVRRCWRRAGIIPFSWLSEWGLGRIFEGPLRDPPNEDVTLLTKLIGKLKLDTPPMTGRQFIAFDDHFPTDGSMHDWLPKERVGQWVPFPRRFPAPFDLNDAPPTDTPLTRQQAAEIVRNFEDWLTNSHYARVLRPILGDFNERRRRIRLNPDLVHWAQAALSL
ncbi:unnamed protein product [Closterium sp. Yama58-4]|nr:unnamed protein product [Closterium sp. Yama58-4]